MEIDTCLYFYVLNANLLSFSLSLSIYLSISSSIYLSFLTIRSFHSSNHFCGDRNKFLLDPNLSISFSVLLPPRPESLDANFGIENESIQSISFHFGLISLT